MAAVKTQGTNLYFIDSATTCAVLNCTAISGISAQRDQIETTHLGDQARTYVAGLASPGAASFEVQFDPSSEIHKDLHDAYKAGTVLKWALGWSDGTAAPTVATSLYTLPATRSFLSFDGYVQDIAFDFSQNSVVKANVSVQVSGFPNLTPKV